ncbi:MAG: AAA family ATPase, partial [Deltaproteobacteria bacterium]|nr:AAA family ATPase [Deltaproteobacteria bacterium]
PRPALIAIEEPELTVHPGALALLCDYLAQGASTGQVVLTTHSPELLDLLDPEAVRVVERIDEQTRVSTVEQGQLDLARDKLFSLGETLRAEGLRAEPDATPPVEPPAAQLPLRGLDA